MTHLQEFRKFGIKISTEQYDLRVLIQHYWRKGVAILKTVDEFAQLGGVEILPHPAYSTSDYDLFRSMQHFFKGCQFESFSEVEEVSQEFLIPRSHHGTSGKSGIWQNDGRN